MGYLMIDDRAAGGKLQEFDTVSCRHCQAVMKVVRGQPEGYYCTQCAGPICDVCGSRSRGECEPFMKKVEEKLRRQALFKAMGLGG